MTFEFATAGRIVFGRGCLSQGGKLAASLGKRAFVVTGKDRSRAAGLLALLDENRVAHRAVCAAGEPSFAFIRETLSIARDFRPDLVIGFGGGSALDTAKALAALLSNGGDPLDYAEVVGAGKLLALPSLPCIAIPTTSGTGSEVTRNAVLAHEEEGVKVSLRSPTMLPSVALVDPDLTLGLPPRVTADTGLDALAQLIEPFTSSKANPLVDALCREGLARAFRSLPKAYAAAASASDDIEAREDMAMASLLGGMALANAGLGAVHGLAGPLGGLTGAPHGAICAALLPGVVAANVRALDSRAPGSVILKHYDEIASLVLGRPAGCDEAGPALLGFVGGFSLRSLRDLGLSRSDFALVAERARAASSMKANPIALDWAEIMGILEAAW